MPKTKLYDAHLKADHSALQVTSVSVQTLMSVCVCGSNRVILRLLHGNFQPWL